MCLVVTLKSFLCHQCIRLKTKVQVSREVNIHRDTRDFLWRSGIPLWLDVGLNRGFGPVVGPLFMVTFWIIIRMSFTCHGLLFFIMTVVVIICAPSRIAPTYLRLAILPPVAQIKLLILKLIDHCVQYNSVQSCSWNLGPDYWLPADIIICYSYERWTTYLMVLNYVSYKYASINLDRIPGCKQIGKS